MASIFTSNQVATTVVPKTYGEVISAQGTYELTAALVINDVIQMVKIPKNAVVDDVILGSYDLDTGGSPSLVLAVGDGTTADRFITGSTIAQGGGIGRANQVDGMGYAYTAEDTIDVKVITAPATGATSGTINLTVLYHMK
jgi:hypothetical protein